MAQLERVILSDGRMLVATITREDTQHNECYNCYYTVVNVYDNKHFYNVVVRFKDGDWYEIDKKELLSLIEGGCIDKIL